MAGPSGATHGRTRRIALAGLVAVFFGATPSLAQEPADAVAFDSMFCGEVTQHANWVNANIDAGMANGAPLMADVHTRYDAISVSCEERIVAIRHFLDDTDQAFAGDRAEQRRRDWNALYCGPGVWGEAVELGWTIELTLSLRDAQYRMIASCE